MVHNTHCCSPFEPIEERVRRMANLFYTLHRPFFYDARIRKRMMRWLRWLEHLTKTRYNEKTTQSPPPGNITQG